MSRSRDSSTADAERVDGLLTALRAGDGVAARRRAAELDQDERWTVLAGAATTPLAVELLVEEVDATGTVRRFVRRLLLDEHAVDDVVQDSLVSVASSVGGFDGRSKVSTWVHQIVQRRVVDHLRRQRATAPLPENDLAPSARISSIRASRATVQDAVAALPERYRERPPAPSASVEEMSGTRGRHDPKDGSNGEGRNAMSDWIGLLSLLVYPALAYGLYWIIRLGVRHGVRDAKRRQVAASPEKSESPRLT